MDWTIVTAASITLFLIFGLFIVFFTMSGAGKLEGLTTMGGIYSVIIENPKDTRAICYVHKDIKAMSCLPLKSVMKNG